MFYHGYGSDADAFSFALALIIVLLLLWTVCSKLSKPTIIPTEGYTVYDKCEYKNDKYYCRNLEGDE